MDFQRLIGKLHREESAQDLLEYALVLLAVLTAVIAGATTIADTIGAGITSIASKILAATK